MPGLNLPPTPFLPPREIVTDDVETSLRRVIDKIILPMYPDIIGYDIVKFEMSNSKYDKILGYQVVYGINNPINNFFELRDETRKLYYMIGPPKNSLIKISMSNAITM
jgi:hypothetical protein